MELTNGNGVVHSNNAIGLIRGSDIVHEMQGAYLDYAMSVIVARALPDVRDGLKPVHRRILYAMYHDLGLDHTKPHKKSARIVGEVLGKYHPHGDTAVYDAMVRMAQEFSLRYPLVDGQGNFGSVDGDNAAAMRYTEARLSEISQLVLADLDKDTVDWHDNFDNSLREPDILPSALPNLLINGSSGIAVGMATNVPPHNLGEVVDALAYLIDHYDEVESITVEQLMQFVKGPDFPTGGILYRYRDEKGDDNVDVIAQSYSVGRSRLVMQAKAHFEEMSRGRSRIVVTELPYQTNKVALIERIASLVRDGKLEGITDLRDESDRAGMRMVIELTRNVEPKVVLADLFKQTPLQQTFGLQMLALVDGEPRTLSLKRMLQLFVQHRQEIIRRRSEYDLKRARERAHILEGLLRALDILDQVIDTIRRSQNAETARNNLVSNFKFTEIQAQAILDMQLRRLAALERRKLQEEHRELLKQIAYLEDLLAHPAKILGVIKEDLLAIKEKYGDARRTQIVDRTKGTLTTTDLLPDQEVWVTVSANGDLRRQDTARATATGLRQVGKGSEVALLTANTRDYLYLFARDGRCRRVSIHEIPQSGEDKHLAELTDFSRRDAITAALTLPRTGNTEGYLFLATEQGMVKRVTLADFMAASAATDLSVMNVEERDRLVGVFTTAGEQEVMLVSNEGQSIRFAEEDVRSMGLAAGGVGGMRLKKGYGVIYAAPVDPEGELLTITAHGYAKRTPLSEYSSQGRNGGGIVTHKIISRTGAVTAALLIGSVPPEALIVVPRKGGIKSVELEEIPSMGRGVQGKQIVEMGDTNPVVALRGVWSSYQTALENRVVVEEEVEAVAIGTVKKESPFPKAAAVNEANGTANGTPSPSKATAPADNGDKPKKPAKAEATPARTARKSVAKPASQTASKAKADVPAPAPTREKVEREVVKVKAGVPVAEARRESTKRQVPKAKAEVVEPTPKREKAQRAAPKAKAEATTPTPKRERVQREAPKVEQPIASPKRESVKREVHKKVETAVSTPKREAPKAKAAAKKLEQPQQPSLLPDDKSLETAPRRNQKLAAVTSVKRPKK
ncbi:MAG: DNA gyrase subunit A [Caldilineaceae bacterium]|nr:DNA gyrase subunit A [Caldilineaceae bacterium]